MCGFLGLERYSLLGLNWVDAHARTWGTFSLRILAVCALISLLDFGDRPKSKVQSEQVDNYMYVHKQSAWSGMAADPGCSAPPCPTRSSPRTSPRPWLWQHHGTRRRDVHRGLRAYALVPAATTIATNVTAHATS